ncbi:hypothetical protein [Nocardia sp. NBC_01329]|uniref:hypothetical protein n=1 Tax=Nocardia sp. NBC_01329 TaxID=2903594 RepID=UPI002E12C8C8|nr:hypothetical protein OG405_03530 [Nocardia sp. NBC_01329]
MTTAHLRIAVTAIALATATSVGPAPGASAAVSSVSVSGGFGLGFVQYGTSCAYTLTVLGDGVGVLEDRVNGQPGGGTFGPIEQVGPGKFTADWAPAVPGRHLVSADGVAAEVNVQKGYDFGIICFTLPEYLRLPD